MTPTMHRFALLVAAATVLSSPTAAIAREKSDVIVLVNGDRITGEIEELKYGELSVKTDSLGTVQIRWLDIARIESKQTFYVDSITNDRYTGTIESGSGAGHIFVADTAKGDDFPVAEVARIGQLEAQFRDRFSGTASLGINHSSSSKVTQSSLSFDTGYRSGKLIASFEGDASSTNTSDLGTVTQYALGMTFQYLRPNDNFWIGTTSFESNEQQGIDGRLVVGAGVGRYLHRTAQSELAAFGGVGLVQEWAASTGSDLQSVEGMGGIQWKVFRLHDPETSLTSQLILLPSLTESGRYRANAGVTLRHEIVKDLFLDLSFNGAYDNEPPVADADTFAYTVTTSLGYKF